MQPIPRGQPNLDFVFKYLAGGEATPAKTRAPNVTCNVRGVGLASKVCHFRNNLHFLMNRTAPADGTIRTFRNRQQPMHRVVYGLSTTCWGPHVASRESDR